MAMVDILNSKNTAHQVKLRDKVDNKSSFKDTVNKPKKQPLSL